MRFKCINLNCLENVLSNLMINQLKQVSIYLIIEQLAVQKMKKWLLTLSFKFQSAAKRIKIKLLGLLMVLCLKFSTTFVVLFRLKAFLKLVKAMQLISLLT